MEQHELTEENLQEVTGGLIGVGALAIAAAAGVTLACAMKLEQNATEAREARQARRSTPTAPVKPPEHPRQA